MAATNIVNAEHLGKAYGTRIVLDDLSLGLAQGDVIGVVGRNGDGKSTLLGLLTGSILPDEGKVTQTRSTSIGVLAQAERIVPGQSVRDLVLDGEPDHVWASDPLARPIVEQMLADIDLDAQTANLSGGERRRAALVALMLGNHDLLVLDEPTNHLDVEAVSWLAQHLRTLQQRGTAMLVVSHDRYFLERVCDVTYALMGDGSCVLLPGGIDQYLEHRRRRDAGPSKSERAGAAEHGPRESGPDDPGRNGTADDTPQVSAAQLRQIQKDMARYEGKMDKAKAALDDLYQQMAEAATDYEKLTELQGQADEVQERLDELETAWLEAAQQIE